jgi:hypothetical protein
MKRNKSTAIMNMASHYEKEVTVNGKKAKIVWNKLCADGPVDVETGEPLIDPETGEPYEGLNDDMAALISNYVERLKGNKYISGKNAASSGDVPRFGFFSLLATKTPVFVYDHPILKQRITNTAFTDGNSIFICADLMRRLATQEKESNGGTFGVIWVLLHELYHKALEHVYRMQNYDPKIANIAQDKMMNGRLVKSFPTLKPTQLIIDLILGMLPTETEKFANTPEEVIAEGMLREIYLSKKKEEEEKQKKKEDKKKEKQSDCGGGGGDKGNQSGSGSGGDEENENDDFSDLDNEENNDKEGNENDDFSDLDNDTPEQPSNKNKKNGTSQKKSKDTSSDDMYDDDGEKFSEKHHVTPEELSDILGEIGLDHIHDVIKLPRKGDVEGFKKRKEQTEGGILDAIQKAQAGALKFGSSYPGKEATDSIAETIGGLKKGKLKWKHALRKAFVGDGQRMSSSDAVPAIPWMLSKSTMGVDPFYIGSLVPARSNESILVIMDSSGSTKFHDGLRNEFANETLGLLKSGSDSARKVYFYCADVSLIGEPLEINENNYSKIMKDGLPVFDGGGTCFTQTLEKVLETKTMKQSKEKLKVVLYFTDCEDQPPPPQIFKKYQEKGISIIFITSSGLYKEQWAHGLEKAGITVVPMEEGIVVDTSLENQKHNKQRIA